MPLFHKKRSIGRRTATPQMIRESIDYLPGGICFSTPNGMPILVNRKMNELAFLLTGHTIMNAKSTWEDLTDSRLVNGCIRLEALPIRSDPDEENSGESMLCSLPDGSVWRFRREGLSDCFPHYIQMEAADVSALYQSRKELYENNRRLAEQYERQQDLLMSIVERNRKEEILQAKMKIHGDLGRSIIATKQYITDQEIERHIPELSETWENTIRSLADFRQIDADAGISPEIELQKAAELIGCRIQFSGDRPVARKTALLFYATVREALTNAVMHANADLLCVTVKPTGLGYLVEISDNGTKPVNRLTEGSGLGNLRRRLEQEKATLEIRCNGGVTIITEIPCEARQVVTEA